MTRQEKKYYLNSAAWKSKRKRRLQHDGYRCTSCCSKKKLTIHHLKPENYGHETLQDIITLCVACHSNLHKTMRTTLCHSQL